MRIFLIISLLILVSCKSQKEEQFAAQIKNNLIELFLPAIELEVLEQGRFNTGESLESFPSLNFPMVRAKILNENFDHFSGFCLFYLMPNNKKKKPGVISFVENYPGEDCFESQREREPFWEISKVEKFEVSFARDKQLRIKNSGSLGPYEIFLKIDFQGRGSRKEFIAERFSLQNLKRKRSRSILTFPHKTFDLKAFPYTLVGDYGDKYENKSQQFCYQVDKNCQVIKEFDCDSCRYGWTYVPGGECGEDFNAVCGVDRCGERGEFACPRGQAYLRGFVRDIEPCSQDSPLGYCQEGLVPICDENKNLVCL